jgi:hypothetical protein
MAQRATKGDEESPLVGRTPTSALDPLVQPLPSQGARLRGQGTRPTKGIRQPSVSFSRVEAHAHSYQIEVCTECTYTEVSSHEEYEAER